MKKRGKVIWAQLLSATMAASLVLPTLPPLETFAATEVNTKTYENAETHDWQMISTDGVFEKRTIGGEKWMHMESGANDGNNHNLSAETGAEFALIAAGTETTGKVETSLKLNVPGTWSNNRFGVYPKYVDDNNWLYVGFDAGNGWYYEYKVDGKNYWPKIEGLSAPVNDMNTDVTVTLDGSKLTVKVGEESITVDKADIAPLTEKTGSLVLRAASYGTTVTSVNFKDVIFNGATVEDTAWSTIKERDGQIFKEITVGGEEVLHLEATDKNSNNLDNGKPALIQDMTVGTFKDGSVEFTVVPDPESENKNPAFGMAFRYSDNANWAYVGYDSYSRWYWEYDCAGDKESSWTRDIGSTVGVSSIPEEGMKVKVGFEGSDVTVSFNDKEAFKKTVEGAGNIKDGSIAFKAGSDVSGLASVNIKDITYTVNEYTEVDDPEDVYYEAPETLSTDLMDVGIDNKFPRVAGYTLKGDELAGKKMYGQPSEMTTLVLNRTKAGGGYLVTPTVEFEKVSDTQAKYVMHVDDENIKADITATITVEGRSLAFDITDVKTLEGSPNIVTTIDIPNHNLVSVRSNQADATFAGSNMSVNTHISGDTYADVEDLKNGKRGYMYAFVSADGLSAGLWSNSENNVTADWQRVTATTADVTYGDNKTCKEVGLSSTFWTCQKGEGYRAENTEGELPSTKIIITGDANEDKTADWQDGAIAYREIMNNPLRSETVPDRVAMRIAMNFGSQAQNPFLKTLDNAKRVYLNTDGLGQSILLKGYGSEGHDSGHLNYADIGTRMGGAEDMATLIKEGAKIGATFGIHVNASETYPESKYFNADRLMKLANGTYDYGWNWLDQGVNINADYDLRNGRAQRFQDLKDVLDQYDAELDYIYVDVWGNGQSGDNGTWASRQLAKEILNCGWRVAGEWGHANEYDSTFQHWATDLSYGGFANKGINSAIARFIRNHQKDSWVGDDSDHNDNGVHGGAAVNPLLGGYDMHDFEGWQGASDYEGYIKNLFDDDLSTKFVQHFLVMKWENGTPVTMTDNGQTYSWTPEMRITLQDKEKKNTLIIERQSNNVNTAEYSLRTMTFNGKKIMDGEKYLIPWYWDENGNDLAAEEQKLYHWNQQGGETTWELPAEWAGLSNVKLYRLTENGKTDEKDIAVTEGKITLNAEASVPYVIRKGESSNVKFDWSVGMHLNDCGFTSEDPLSYWDVTGKENTSITESIASDDMLQFSGEGSVTQKLTDLTPGQQYAAYVGVENRSDAKAYIEVNTPDGTVSNYTERSIAYNYISAYSHNTTKGATISGGGSLFQNMYVFFTAPESGEVTLTLKREAGEGVTYFDDVRVCESNAVNHVSEDKFVQDFEQNVQGIYPFVVGPIEGVTDNRTHLSEFHAPYTQYGWNNKKVDDVIEGNWSLKTNGLVQRRNLVYQTIPQNFRFEPGVTYNVTFDYEAGSDGTYALVIGDGPYSKNGYEKIIPLEKSGSAEAEIPEGTPSATKGNAANTYKFRIAGAKSGQSWIGIYSTSKGADTEGIGGKEADFRGYKDFILDNLVIEKSAAQKVSLESLVEENSGRFEANYTAGTWAVFADAMAAANAALEDFDSTQNTVDKAEADLKEAVENLVVIGSTLRGRIDDTVFYLDGTTVTAENEDGYILKVETDENGRYVMPGVLFGTWTVKAEDDTHNAVTETITADKDNLELTQDFVLERATTNISGKVSAVGIPAEGAEVTVSCARPRFTKTVTTDKHGDYLIEGVPTVSSDMEVKLEGYDVYTTTVDTVKGKEAVCNVMLQPLSTVDYSNSYDDGQVVWKDLAGNTSSTTIKSENGANTVSFPGGGHANVYETKAPVFQNGSVEMDLTSEASGIRLGILLRANDMNNRVYVGVGDSENQYFAEYWGSKEGNAWSAMHAGESFTAGKTMHLKAEIVGKTVKLWVNDKLVVEETMNSMPTAAGYVGLNCRAGKKVHIDNIKVSSYDDPTGDVQTVVGNIRNEGEAAEGITVNLEDLVSGEVIKTVQTDALGNYKFKNVPFGAYHIRAMVGQTEQLRSVTVAEAEGYVIVDPIAVGETTPAEVDKTTLQKVYDTYKDYKEAQYMPATWKLFADALAQAKTVLENGEATTEQVLRAEMSLTAAVGALEVKPDRAGLETIVTAADKKAESDYTADSWMPFKKALDNAKAMLANNDATAEDLRTVQNALVQAMEALEPNAPVAVDKTKLDKAIAEADKLNKDDYTADSWKVLEEALVAAKEAADNKNATQAKVDNAEEALNAAIESLREKMHYDDVSKNDWFFNEVQYAYDNGIMTGLSDNEFGSYVTLSRAHFVLMLYRLEGNPEVDNTIKYPDVADGEWYADAVKWATKAGIVTGYDNTGMFGPADAITREQLATMMYRYATYKEKDTSAKADFSEFKDGNKVSEFAKKAMEWAVGSEIIKGKFEGTQLDPQGDTARAEAAIVLTRFIQKLEESAGERKVKKF